MCIPGWSNVHRVYPSTPQRQEGSRSIEIGVIGSYRPPDVDSGN